MTNQVAQTIKTSTTSNITSVSSPDLTIVSTLDPNMTTGVDYTVNSELNTRNMIGGILIITFTIVSVPIIVQTKLNVSVKATLLNISANSFVLVVLNVLHGRCCMSRDHVEEDACHVVRMSIISCTLLMHILVVVVSLNNYYALKSPFRYAVVDQGTLATWTSVSIWLVTAILIAILSNVILASPAQAHDDVWNNILGAFPWGGLMVLGLGMFASDACVFTLNILICKKLSRKRMLVNKTTKRADEKRAEQFPADSRAFGSTLVYLEIKNILHGDGMVLHNLPFGLQMSHTERKTTSSPYTISRAYNAFNHNKRNDKKTGDPITLHEVLEAMQQIDGPGPNNTRMENVNTPKRSRRLQRCYKQSRSLAIVSFWSFFMNFSFVVFILYLSLQSEEDRLKYVHSPMGAAALGAAALSSMGHPLLCIWRFIAWKDVCRKTIKS